MIKKIELTHKGKKVTGRQIVVTSEFETNIENIWCKIQDVDSLREICNPRASFVFCDDSLLVWEEGKSFLLKVYLHKIIPLGKHTLNMIKIDKKSREIVSNEHNKAVQIWNHYIKMEDIHGSTTRYTDVVDLYAGFLTPVIAWWSLKFYKHRQRKWQKIARTL